MYTSSKSLTRYFAAPTTFGADGWVRAIDPPTTASSRHMPDPTVTPRYTVRDTRSTQRPCTDLDQRPARDRRLPAPDRREHAVSMSPRPAVLRPERKGGRNLDDLVATAPPIDRSGPGPF